MKESAKFIGPIIRKARKEKGLSQRELGLKTHIPQSHISRIESGQVNVEVSTLLEIVRLLDMDLMIVPKKLVPTIKGFLRPQTGEVRPLYSLEPDEDDDDTY